MASRPRDVVVIGGSAGAVEALTELFTELPPDLAAAVGVVLHRHPTFASSLAELFGRRSTLKVIEPEQGEPFKRGCIYLAPADRHMTIYDGTIQLNRQPKEHHTRPAVDPLFRSVARAYGGRVVGVLLSGNLSDGAGGLIEIKQHGGLSLVQDPREAAYPSMPQNALIYDHVDLVFRLRSLPELLTRLVRGDSVESAEHMSGARAVAAEELSRPPWLAAGHKLP